MNTLPRLILWALVALLLPVRNALAQNHQITPWKHNRSGAVSMTFDDGYWTQVTNAVPLLNARSLKGTFFVTTGTTEVTWDQWSQLALQGHEIASHSVSHPDFVYLTDSELRYQLSEPQRAIRENIPSQSCLTISYPYTDNNAYVRAVTSEYYIAARGGWAGDEGGNFNFYEDIPSFWPWPAGIQFGQFKAVDFYNTAAENIDFSMAMSLLDAKLDIAIAYNAWYCVYLHAVPTEGIGYLATLLDHIVARDLWMATYEDVAQYMRRTKGLHPQRALVGRLRDPIEPYEHA
ncbi:MAG: polysaccharide deacetylase family protein [Anaerotruncus sp.]|nr:polysaccharide deacetylase family protein [Anaerotruncus sp.]